MVFDKKKIKPFITMNNRQISKRRGKSAGPITDITTAFIGTAIGLELLKLIK